MTLTKNNLRAAESAAYRKLIAAIDEADADPSRRLASVLESKPFELFMAGWIGVEATSLYVTFQSTWTTAGLEFLHDAVGASAPPIFSCSPVATGKAGFCETHRLDEVSAERWRTVQRQSLEGGLKGRDTSAALCARHLLGSEPGKPRHLLLHFAEILGYSFVYHLLENGWSATESTVARGHALAAWGTLCRTHAKRSGAAADVLAKELLQVLRDWYERTPAQDVAYSRDFLGSSQIYVIYRLGEPLKAELEGCVQTPTDEAVGSFVTNWATALMLSLSMLGSANSDLKNLFWDTTLINPRVEEAFLTRGLYVTIIRSPQMPALAVPADRLSQGYAICTLYDSRRLELEVCRGQLDVVLRRIAHEDLALYNYRTLQQTFKDTENRLARTEYVQGRLRRLQDSTSNPDVGYEQLVVNAANACHDLASSVGVLIASPDLGVYSSWKAPGDGAAKTLWCESFSGVGQAALVLAAELRADESEGYEDVHELATSRYAGRLNRIFGDLRLSSTEDYRYAAFLVETDPRGLMLLVFRGSPNATTGEVRNVAEILAIGMAMSFRSAIGRGLLSLFADAVWSVGAGIAGNPRDFFRRVRANWGRGRGESKDSDGRHRRSSFEWLKDLCVATIVEVTRAGLVLIGLLFTVLVFLILWHGYKATRGVVYAETGVFANQKLIETLGYVEALVMAFSICLAATGVVFLLKPGLATGQPGWMRRFAELGTLEKSLVRLAAMVLTIDLLTTALNPLSARQETLFRVLLYLCILVGLAFLSAFLLADRQDDRSREEGLVEDARSEDSMSSAWSRFRRTPRPAKSGGTKSSAGQQ